jgi:Putative mono-oxygenase ydhR
MSPKVNVQIEFDLRCTSAEYRGLADHVAGAIAAVPGLLWKVWILDEERRRGGGVYLFANRVAATAYLEGPIVSRLRGNPAVANVEARLFDVLEGPSVITRGLSASGQTPEDARAPRAVV